MICIIAMVTFGILGIFSAKYRIIAKEAFDCVFRRVTLRKCTSGLDKRLKSQITGKLMRKNPKFGRFIYRKFEIISWFFTILLILSLLQTGISVYNFIAYGNCNGKGSDEFCIFDPLNKRGEALVEVTQCTIPGHESTPTDILIPPPIGTSASFGNPTSNVKVIEFGCYSCPFTREAESAYKKIRENYGGKIHFIYKNFPISTHNGSYDAAIAAECVRLQDDNEFWKYHEALFEHQGDFSIEKLIDLATNVNINVDKFKQCVLNKETKSIVDKDIEDGTNSNIYGTPTLFINDDSLVGPKTYREIKSVIKKALS